MSILKSHKRILRSVLMLLTLCGALCGSVVRASAQSEDFEEAGRLKEQAFRLLNEGRYEEADPIFQRILTIVEKIVGGDSADFALVLNSFGDIFYEKGQYLRAEPLYNRALKIREKTLGAEHPEVATTLSNLAFVCVEKEDYACAEQLFQRSLAINEKALGAEHLGVATSLNSLAFLYGRKGDYARAEPLYRRALDIREKALGVEHPEVANSLNNLAVLYDTIGDYAKAEALYKRALAIREKVFGTENPEVAQLLSNIASLYQAKGAYAKAEPLMMRALEIREKSLGSEHGQVAESLNNLAGLFKLEGDYTRAEPLYQRALAIREKALGPEHSAVAQSLNNLAVLYDAKGDYVRAEAMYRRALAIQEKTLGAEHAQVAVTLNNLAMLIQSRAEYSKAEPLLKRALAIREKAFGTENPDVATSLDNLAALYHDKGDFDLAIPLYKRALAIKEKTLGTEHPAVAATLNNLAALYGSSGDNARAEQLYNRALAISEKKLGRDHPNNAILIDNIAAVHQSKGEMAKAVVELSRVAEIDERNITLLLNAGSANQKQLYLDTLKYHTYRIVSLNVEDVPTDKTATQLALTTILRRKGRALDAMADQIGALRRRATPEDQKLLDQLTAARSQLANAQLGGDVGNITPAERSAQSDKLTDEVEKLENAIGRRSAEFRAQAQSVTLANVQSALPSGAALIEIIYFQPYNSKPKSQYERYGAAHYVAYVTRHDGEPGFVDLGEAAPIEASVERLRGALRDPNRDDVKALARTVDEQVMRPVRQLLGATRRVFLSPDGALNLIPFAALVDERGHYLVEDYSITYLTSGRDLLRLQAKGESKQPPLVLANPLYDAGNKRSTDSLTSAEKRAVEFKEIDFSKLFYAPLSGTADEAKTLSALMPGSQVMSASDATEAALKASHAPRILHIATHGFFLSNQAPLEGTRGLKLAQATELSDASRSPDAAAPIENPLLRSGLILAGVNQRNSGTGEDGVLTASEAAALDLWGTRLVVLSACETGLGDVKNGDGVYGLRRALVLAGSETQVMSLWQVSDEATRDLMKGFYSRLQLGEGRTDALREIQLEMLKGAAHVEGGMQRGLSGTPDKKTPFVNRAHPFFWASFIQSGAWTGIKDEVVKK